MPDTKQLSNLHDVLEATITAGVHFEDVGRAWWRGQSDFSWKLWPSVHRRGKGLRDEKNLTLMFRSHAATRHPKCPAQDDFAAWLFLARHYGLPVRLLDWTDSILVATYFAVSDPTEGPAALWALRPAELNRTQIDVEGILTPDHKAAKPLFEAPFAEGDNQSNKVLAVQGNEVDIRMLVQQSVYTIHGDAADPLDDWKDSDSFLLKFEIPRAVRDKIRDKLSTLGITTAALFPDLEHLADELASLQFLTSGQ
jgi:hypothetical protein